jgi:hypothetical protein
MIGLAAQRYGSSRVCEQEQVKPSQACTRVDGESNGDSSMVLL